VAQVRVVIRRETFRCGFGQDFAAIIDIERVCQYPPGAWRNELVQVEHRFTFFPQKRVQRVPAVSRSAYNLPASIQPICSAAGIAVHCSQIFDLSVFPNDRIVKIYFRPRSRKIC